MGGLLLPANPIYSFLFWAGARHLSKTKNFRIHDTSRIFSVSAHSEGEEARKLEDFSRVSRQWKMVLGDFTLPGQIDTI